MEHWDLRTLDVQPRQPQILQSVRGDARSIAINLPAGEALQDHEVHERAHLIIVDGEVDIDQNGVVTAAAAGTFFVFEAHERHEVRARSDARLLLILAPWPGQGHPGARDD